MSSPRFARWPEEGKLPVSKMPLSPGTRLGAYQIVAAIGAGGMGEVYRAHDSRLGRDVAIKVLPSPLSGDPASLARFEREARAIGALNHPNIVNVFDVGTDGGVSYVVMELVEGETLRARLQGGGAHTPAVTGKTPGPATSATSKGQGLARKKALEIAQQIAQGLAAAHARGIVHRDLKPENIFLTNDGRVKILDFGLARALPDQMQQMGDAQTRLSPNVAAADSVPGMVLGTVGYMAPEQVRGQAVDHRADIFAFGVVLYEMLTGTRAFDCETPIETLSAILKADPLEEPVATVAISGPIEPLLRHCLEKQPDERFQSARDLAFQLQAIASGSLSTGAAERIVGARTPRRWLLPAVAAAMLAAGLALGYLARPRPSASIVTLSMTLPANVHVWPGASPARSGGLAVSPDGRQIAFVGEPADAARQIYVRSLDSSVARVVPGTEGAWAPAWSPDGRRLAYLHNRKLTVSGLDGSARQTIGEMNNPRSAPAWGEDDTILYHADYRLTLLRLPASGGTPATVLPAAEGHVSWFSPVWLPGGRRFLVVRFNYRDKGSQPAGIYAGSVDSSDVTLLVEGPISEVALGDGAIFYRRGLDLVSQAFDARAVKVSGQPEVLSNHVSMIAAAGGTLVYYDPPSGLSQGHRITLFSRNGQVLSQIAESGTFRDPRLSPDGRYVAVARAGETGTFSIWTYDLARGIDTRVTGATYVSPAWSPDGKFIYAGGPSDVTRFEAGGGAPELVRDLPTYANVADIHANNADALLQVLGADAMHFAALSLDGKSEPRPITPPEPLVGQQAAFSRSGKWVAFTALQGTGRRLFVKPYPGPGSRVPVTAADAYYPRWSGDDRELYYLNQADGATGVDAIVMVVPVTWTAAGPDFGPPKPLLTIPRPFLSNHAYDVTRDGQKFVAVVQGQPDLSPLTVRLRR
jgi:serine/threonine protein kinase/Tol biopolymer transport system component